MESCSVAVMFCIYWLREARWWALFVLVVTGKKELADDKAVLLSNAHHGLCLLKLEAGCTVSARLGESVV